MVIYSQLLHFIFQVSFHLYKIHITSVVSIWCTLVIFQQHTFQTSFYSQRLISPPLQQMGSQNEWRGGVESIAFSIPFFMKRWGFFTSLCMQAQSFSCVQLLVTPQTVACQAPLSIGFSRHKYWSGLPFLPVEELPNPGIKLTFPALVDRFFNTVPSGKLPLHLCFSVNHKTASPSLSILYH